MVEPQNPEQLKEEEQEKERDKTEKTLKIFSIVIGVLLLIVLIIVKVYNPNFPLFWVIILGVVVAVVSAIIYFSFTIFRWITREKEEKGEKAGGLPKAASLATLRGMSESALTNKFYANHLKKCKEEKFFHIGKNKNRIYMYRAEALYTDDMKKGEVVILINAHYPEDLRTILIDPSSSEISHAVNSLANEPEAPADEEESMIWNPVTQTYVSSKKIIHKKQEEKKEEKKEDLE